MSTNTLDIYNLLVSAGIDKDKAEPLARELVTRADAAEFATKSDIASLKVEIYKAAIAQAAFIVAVVGALLAFTA